MKKINNTNFVNYPFLRGLILPLFLTLFSTLAFAQAPSTTSASEKIDSATSQEVILTPIGFDKVLSLLLFDIENSKMEIEIAQASTGRSIKSTIKIPDSEVVELDLNDFDTGSYMLKTTAGEFTSLHSFFLP